MDKKLDAKVFIDKALDNAYKITYDKSFPNLFFDAINKGLVNKSQLLKLEYRFNEDWLSNIEIFFQVY